MAPEGTAEASVAEIIHCVQEEGGGGGDVRSTSYIRYHPLQAEEGLGRTKNGKKCKRK